MPDVLSSGFPEQDEEVLVRPPPYRPRWVSVVLLLALVAGAAALAVRQGTGRPHAAEPTPSRTPIAPAPHPPPPAVPVGLPPDPVYRLDGDPGAGPAGTRLLVGGRQPGMLDAATGDLTPLPAAGVAGESAHVLPGRGYAVVLVGVGSRPLPRAVLMPDGGGGAVPLGPVSAALPRRDGTVLTLTCPAGPPCTMSDRTRTGRTVWSRGGSEPLALLADTPAGLLAGRYGEGGLALRLVEPRSGRTLRVIGWAETVLGVSDRRLAWTPAGCASACPVVVAELADGRARTLPAAGGRPATGAFSGDSQRLAVGFVGLEASDPDRSRQRDGYAAVLDLRTPGWVR
ncbi:MAG TPA: hypothetical protein VF109_10060, partial [Mycobacteriales bacterium]